jgi:hypothetical protein
MWKKVCLDVLHIELVIMYKLFLSLRVYDFVIKFFVTCCCEAVTVYVLALAMQCCQWTLCCESVCCCNACCCNVIRVCCAAHVCVCWVARTASKLFTDVDVVDAVVDQLITNNFYFFFFNVIWDRVYRPSCSHHVMTCHVVLTSLPCVTNFFFSYIFFFHTLTWLLLSSCRY